MGSLINAANLRFDHNLKSFATLFDFYLSAPERVRSKGAKVVAKGPLSPGEVYYAAGTVPYDIVTRTTLLQSVLNEHTDVGRRAIESGMSPEMSPWNLSTLGATLDNLGDLDADMYSTAVGGFDDQITKCFQVLATAKTKPLRFWEVPIYDGEAREWGLEYTRKELEQLFQWLQSYTGRKVTEEALRHAICLGNVLRRDMAELNTCLAMPRIPIPGLEYYLVQMMMGDYAQEPEALHLHLTELIGELKERVDLGQSAPVVTASPIRIYMMGDETQELRLYNAIEEYGGVLVGCDFRWPLYYELIDEGSEPISSIAKWVWHMPNNLSIREKVKMQTQTIKNQKPDAVIISSVVGSRHGPGLERLLRDQVKRQLGLQVLALETTLPHENSEKLDYQIRAFFETIK